jgi:hypothetical protein
MKTHLTPPSPNLRNLARKRLLLPSLPLMVIAVLGIALQAQAQKFLITSNWFAANGIGHIATGDNNRGLAYSALSNVVFVCNKATPAIDALDAATGNLLGSAVTTGVAGGTFLLDQVEVADDGNLYSGNLSTSINTAAYKLYQWTNWTTTPTLVFSGDPASGTLAGQRMGDNMAVQGSGTGTVVLVPVEAGTRATTNVVLFSTVDGTTFTPTVVAITNMPIPPSGNNGPAIAVSFYTNNTFLFKQGGPALYLVQYPVNFASLPSPVAGTVIGTNTTFQAAGNVGQTVINYSAAGNLLATVGPIPNSAPSTTPITLSLANPLSGASSSVGSTNTAHPNGNGNFVGGVALGGAGKTNLLFTLDCNNGVVGWGLAFVPAPVSPIISSFPVGGSVYTNAGSFTFSVSASGTAPLVYYWQYNTVSNPATAQTVTATTNLGSFVVSPLTVATSGWYSVIVSNAAGTTNVAAVQLTVTAPQSSPYVTQLWSLPADNSQPYLDTGYNTRGLAFDPNTMLVVLAEHAQASISALYATNGQFAFTLTTPSTGLPAGSIFPLGQVGVADDGVLYCCNVSSYNPYNSTAIPGTSDFSITRFSSITDPNGTNPYTLYAAFTGDPGFYSPGNPGVSSQDRWGDSFAIRGAGNNTQILLGSYTPIGSPGNYQFGTGPGTNVCILTTQNGSDFNATTITVTNAPGGFAYLGVAWGTNNTFWAKSPGYNLRQVQYDLMTGIGTVIQSIGTPSSIVSLAGIGLDNVNNVMAGVQINDTPNDVQVFEIPALGFAPQPYYQAFFGAYNPNINGNAATTVKFPYIFSLDANNGIIGLKYSIPLLPFNILLNKSGTGIELTWQTVAGRSYQLQATPALVTTAFTNVGAAFTAGSSGTHSYTNSTLSGSALLYRVVAQ